MEKFVVTFWAYIVLEEVTAFQRKENIIWNFIIRKYDDKMHSLRAWINARLKRLLVQCLPPYFIHKYSNIIEDVKAKTRYLRTLSGNRNLNFLIIILCLSHRLTWIIMLKVENKELNIYDYGKYLKLIWVNT